MGTLEKELMQRCCPRFGKGSYGQDVVVAMPMC